MPRGLYPSYMGRFDTLNRQRAIARERLFDYGPYGRFAQKYLPTMPSGFAGPAWQPSGTEGQLWDRVEQHLHDIMQNPPKYYTDPRDEKQRQANRFWEMTFRPEVLRTQIAAEATRGTTKERLSVQQYAKDMNAHQHAVKQYETAIKTFNDALKQNKKVPGTFSKEYLETLRAKINGAARAAHTTGKKLEYAGLEDAYPEIGKTGLTLKMEKELEEAEKKRKEEAIRVGKEMDVSGIAPSEIWMPPPDRDAAVEALKEQGTQLERAQAEKKITAKQTAEAKKKILAEKDAVQRAIVAADVMSELGLPSVLEPAPPTVPKFMQEQMAPVEEAGPEVAPLVSPAESPEEFEGPEAFMDVSGRLQEALTAKDWSRLGEPPAVPRAGRVPRYIGRRRYPYGG